MPAGTAITDRPRRDRAVSYETSAQWLADVVMRRFATAADRFAAAEHPLDAARCRDLAVALAA